MSIEASMDRFCPNYWKAMQRINTNFPKSVSLLRSQHAFGKKLKNTARTVLYAVAKAVMYIVYPVFLAYASVSASLKRNQHRKLIDCERLYRSPVFTAYHSQLKKFVEAEMEQSGPLQEILEGMHPQEPVYDDIRSLLKILTAPAPKNNSARRVFHTQMAGRLRRLVLSTRAWKESKEAQPQAVYHFVRKLNDWKYKELDLMGPMQEFLIDQVKVSLPEEEEGIEGKIEELILGEYVSVFKQDKYKGNDEAKGRIYDPYLFGDTPSVLFPLNDATRVIRTAVATRDIERDAQTKGLKSAAVTEEFSSYLSSNSNLYINLMARRTGSQQIRSNEIEQLENTHSDRAFVASLDKDSDFYWQRGGFTGQDEAASFKGSFLHQMFLPESENDFYWPKKLDVDEWKASCCDIIEDVHQKIFDGKASLSQPERQDFIEIVYIRIVEKLAEKFEPNTMNLTCLSCIDRGANALSLLYLHQLIKKGKKVDRAEMGRLLSLSFAPALLAQNRLPHRNRVVRLASAAKTLLSSKKGVC